MSPWQMFWLVCAYVCVLVLAVTFILRAVHFLLIKQDPLKTLEVIPNPLEVVIEKLTKEKKDQENEKEIADRG